MENEESKEKRERKKKRDAAEWYESIHWGDISKSLRALAQYISSEFTQRVEDSLETRKAAGKGKNSKVRSWLNVLGYVG